MPFCAECGRSASEAELSDGLCSYCKASGNSGMRRAPPDPDDLRASSQKEILGRHLGTKIAVNLRQQERMEHYVLHAAGDDCFQLFSRERQLVYTIPYHRVVAIAQSTATSYSGSAYSYHYQVAGGHSCPVQTELVVELAHQTVVRVENIQVSEASREKPKAKSADLLRAAAFVGSAIPDNE